MLEFIEILQKLILDFLIFIIIGIAGSIGAYIKMKHASDVKKLDTMQNCLNIQNDRGIRQSKVQIDLAEHMDNETARLHPDKSKNPIKERIERNLRDKDGNL